MDTLAKTPSEKPTKKEKEQVEIPSDGAITKKEEDFLNRKAFVDVIVSLIEANIKPPYSIGIYGDWGSGKTSVMRLIKERIEELGKYRIIWFDAWEYENEANLVYPLVRLIQNELPENKRQQVEESVERLGTVIFKGVMGLALKGVTLGTLSLKELEEYEADYIKKHTKMFNAWIDQVSKVKEEFEKLIKTACEPKKEGEEKKECLVIFIDDLDRCLPENSIKILESIKNIFTKGDCIFILGVDKKTIARVIEARYPPLEEGEGKNYLDKIVSFSFDVPECQELDFDGYFESLFDKLKIELGKVTDSTRIDLSQISNVCVKSRLHNPRKIKKSVIAFYLYYKIRQSGAFDPDFVKKIESEHIIHQDVLMFCLFYEFWNELYEKVLISNMLFLQLAELALSGGPHDWVLRLLRDPAQTHPIIKNYATDENLYHFLRHWGETKSAGDERKRFIQRVEFINTLISIGKLIGLKKTQ